MTNEEVTGTFYTCSTCGHSTIYTPDQIPGHMLDVHKVDVKQIKLRRKLLLKLDGDEFVLVTMSLTFQSDPQVELISTTKKRRKWGAPEGLQEVDAE